MKSQKTVPAILSYILAFLADVSIIYNICTFASACKFAGMLGGLVKIAAILVCLAATMYCFRGYKKDAAKYFALFCNISAAGAFIELLFLAHINAGLKVSLVASLLQFGIFCVFSVAKDLGKTKSYALAAINVVGQLLTFILAFGNSSATAFSVVGKLIIAVIFGIMVYAKYADKESRGTK